MSQRNQTAMDLYRRRMNPRTGPLSDTASESKAQDFVERLHRNCDAMLAQDLPCDEFQRINYAIWRESMGAGWEIHGRVCEILRERNRGGA